MRLARGIEAAGNDVGRGWEHRSRILALLQAGHAELIRRFLMYLQSVGAYGFQRGHVGRQFLQLDRHLFGRRAGLRPAPCRYDGDHVAKVEDLFIAQDRLENAVARGAGMGLRLGGGVGPPHVFGGDDFYHAGHAFRFGSIYGQDIRVIRFGHYQGQMQGRGRHFYSDVAPVFAEAGNLLQRCGAGKASPVDRSVFTRRRLQRFRAALAPHDLRGSHHRVHQRFIAGTAAEIVMALEPVPHLFAGGRKVPVQQRFCRNDEAGGTKTALDATQSDPGLLQGVQVIRRSYALYGHYLGKIRHLIHFFDTAAHRLPVQQTGAGAALAHIAADLRSGKPDPAQHVGKTVARFAHDHSACAVDVKPYLL